jgi:hypothetical protein
VAEIHNVYVEEMAARYSPASHQTFKGLRLKKCFRSDNAWILPMTNSNANIIICETQVSNGKLGAVFEGVLLCADQTCSEKFEAKIVNKSIADDLKKLQQILPPASMTTVNSAIGARKVAVKFASESAAAGLVRNSSNEVLDGNMEKEIKNIQTLQGDFVVKYLGRIDKNPEFKGFLIPADALNVDERVKVTLVGPGLVMEFLEGPTGFDYFLQPRSQLERDNRYVCLLAQIILMFAEELVKGVVNTDLHFQNIIVLESDDFIFTPSIKCKKTKMIDLGFLENIGNFESAVRAIVTR